MTVSPLGPTFFSPRGPTFNITSLFNPPRGGVAFKVPPWSSHPRYALFVVLPSGTCLVCLTPSLGPSLHILPSRAPLGLPLGFLAPLGSLIVSPQGTTPCMSHPPGALLGRLTFLVVSPLGSLPGSPLWSSPLRGSTLAITPQYYILKVLLSVGNAPLLYSIL